MDNARYLFKIDNKYTLRTNTRSRIDLSRDEVVNTGSFVMNL